MNFREITIVLTTALYIGALVAFVWNWITPKKEQVIGFPGMLGQTIFFVAVGGATFSLPGIIVGLITSVLVLVVMILVKR